MPDELGHERVPQVRRGGGDALITSISSAPSSSASTWARASSTEYAGAKRRFTTIVQTSGTTLFAMPPSMRTTCSDSR